MKTCFVFLLGLMAAAAARAANPDPVEEQVTAAVKLPGITVVHFWATWCPNCRMELVNGGWRDFVTANPDVAFVFVTAWDEKPGAPLLEKFGLGAQKNFLSLQHPNPSRKDGEKLDRMLGLPVTWLPTTWVFRNGRLRYAINYGEVRFSMLQQMVRDTSDKWEREDLPASETGAPVAPAAK